jgi:aryl sulfotransferase
MLGEVVTEPVRYVSGDEDSARWIGFPFREGDIVISTRSKTGTTWVQMICALLIFQVPALPEPLGRYSPWLDRAIYPRDEVYARLASQDHRRFIKTHTPLDGIPLDPRVTYLVTARHPLDMAVSLYHQSANINRSWQRQRDGKPAAPEPEPTRTPLRDWLLDWISHAADPRQEMDSLPGVMWHLSDAWNRRGEPNVLLIRYEDLHADLEGQMRWLGERLGITVPAEAWPALIQAATFEHMQADAERVVGVSRILKSSSAFFRRGTPGAGREILTDQEIARYHARTSQLAPQDMLDWLHSPGRSRAV